MKNRTRTIAGLLRLIASVAIAGLLAASCQGGSAGLNSASLGTTSSIKPGTTGEGIRVVADLPPPPDTNSGALQPISQNDVLEVDVFQVDDLDRTVQVDSRGYVTLPLIGEVKAEGKSANQLGQDIARAYGTNYLQSPQVTVFVKESVGQRVTVEGEVQKAGIFPVTADSSLLAAIALSGGLTQIADESKVYLFRRYGSERLVANYSIKDIRNGRKRDPKIYGGDIVVVFSSSSKVALKNLREVMGVASSAKVFIP